MTEQIVAHTEDHETIECPHCGMNLCAHYPADWDTGEACESTYYARLVSTPFMFWKPRILSHLLRATGVYHECQDNDGN